MLVSVCPVWNRTTPSRVLTTPTSSYGRHGGNQPDQEGARLQQTICHPFCHFMSTSSEAINNKMQMREMADDQLISNSYIFFWGMVVLHIGIWYG